MNDLFKLKEILIVEDNEDNSLLVEKILNYYGFKTVVVADGESALRYCETHQPALILMDLSLPDMDGLEVARFLRKKKDYQETPMIALTAHAIQSLKMLSQEAGLNDFIMKPFLPHELMTVIRRHLKY